jgi:hypothetical protein
MDYVYRKTQDVPSSECIGALEIQLDPFLYKAFAVAPLVHPVFEIRVQDLHGCNDEIVESCAPAISVKKPTIGNENAALRVRIIRQLCQQTAQ